MYQIPVVNKKIVHGFSVIDDGDMSFDFLSKEKVVKNRRGFLSKLGIDMVDCISLTVEHGNRICSVTKADKGKGMFTWEDAYECDALITHDKDIFLFLKIADCAPVILYDEREEVLSIIHIGWKNVQNKFIEKVVNYCIFKYKCDCKNLLIYIGPAAKGSSYIVKDPIQLNEPDWKGFIKKSSLGLFEVDFIGLFIRQVLQAGIPHDNIYNSNLDTVDSKLFFSHYRSKNISGEPDGRFACVAGMV